MINSNSNPVQSGSVNFKGQTAGINLEVRSTFQSILSSLSQRPLRPTAVQQFAGSANRSLAQQVRSDTMPVM